LQSESHAVESWVKNGFSFSGMDDHAHAQPPVCIAGLEKRAAQRARNVHEALSREVKGASGFEPLHRGQNNKDKK
jgi:hypothetical protein